MSLGLDLKSAIQETGLAFSLYRSGAVVTTGYIWLKSNAQVTKPFIREFFLEGQVAYDVDVRSGDLVVLVNGLRYLVAHASPDLFENETYRFSVVLYKTNELVSVMRPSQNRDSGTYLARTHWTLVAQNVYSLITSPLFGHELNFESIVGPVDTEIQEMYFPSSYGVQALDLIRLSSGLSFQVRTVKKRRFEGLDVLDLSEDNQTETTTTTTTSTTTTTTTTTTAP